MHSVWRVPSLASGRNPPSVTAGESPDPPPVPPDPPNPSSPLSPVHYPILAEAKTVPRSGKASQRSKTTTSNTDGFKASDVTPNADSTSLVGEASLPPSTAPSFGSGKSTAHRSETELNHSRNFHTLPPRTSSLRSLPPQTEATVQNSNHPTQTKTTNPQSLKQTNPVLETSTETNPTTDPPSLVERIRKTENKTLKRLAPDSIGATGRPRVLIPDSVFQKGAELHKDFIICYFNGKAPPFNQIQSVFNHMWGKGKRLEIHNNPLNHSAIVRIQSEYLREKILEKNIWYVGDSMFHTAQWSSAHSKNTPPLKAIKIWAHLSGIPLDLRHDEGLSLVAGLVGEPKETDDFTKNLVSLTLSHVKVEVDLTQPLPDVVEFEREDGEVVEVSVHYPWIPPTCSHCHELGHII